MTKYVYPAVFTPEKNGVYSINFPDLEGCYTCGDTLTDGIEMAEDVLALVLCDYEKKALPIPVPSSHTDIPLADNEFINYITCDTIGYRKMHNTKSVKKTLTIPEWLNEAALSMNLNFSQVLQDALINIVQK